MNVKAINKLLKELKEATDWLDGLSEHDRNNAVALMNLPNGADLIDKLPESDYKKYCQIIVHATKACSKEDFDKEYMNPDNHG